MSDTLMSDIDHDADDQMSDLPEDLAAEQAIDEPDELIDGADAKTNSRTRKQVTKQQAAKTIAKFIELESAPAEHIEMLATAVGARADAADIAAVIVSSPRLNLGPIADVLALAEATEQSPYAAMLEAMKLDRDQLKQVWSLLGSAGLVTGSAPAKDSAAAVAVAEASARIGEHERSLFESVRNLARK